jgi:hypothetical protein
MVYLNFLGAQESIPSLKEWIPGLLKHLQFRALAGRNDNAIPSITYSVPSPHRLF